MKALIRKIARKVWKEKKLVVLLYHKVSEQLSEFDSLTVTPYNYNAHIAYLKENYKIFSTVSEWEKSSQSGILITFDDGYYNNISNALPVHKEHNVPFTLFTTTYWLNKNRVFWWESVVKNHSSEKRIDVKACGETLKKVMHLKTIDEKETFVGKRIAENVYTNAEWQDLRPMTSGELKQFAANPLVTIGSHTITHPRLSLLDPRAQEIEMKQSKLQLESLLGKEIDLFSYPHGGKTAFDLNAKQNAKQIGYQYAFAAYNGVHTNSSDCFEIPRIHIGNISVEDLKIKLAKFI